MIDDITRRVGMWPDSNLLRPMPPYGYRGPFLLDSGRLIWWSGRVAIGLRYEVPRREQISENAEFIQTLLLQGRHERATTNSRA